MSAYRARRDPEPEPEHSYSSLQFDIIGRPAEIMHKLAAAVPNSDLKPDDPGSDGREHDSHITARWGLHFMTPSAKLRAVLKSFGPVSVTFGKTSLFSNPDMDVLKIDIDSPDLHRLYKVIGRAVPVHTTHPVYRPHATLAYVKPGRGKKYAGDAALVGTKMTFSSLTFSGKKGHMENLPLTGGNTLYRAR